MPAINLNALDDLVLLTYNKHHKNKSWTDISLAKNQYHMVDRFLRGKKMPVRGTPSLLFTVQHTNNANFRYTGAFDTDTYSVGNLAVGGSYPWAHTTSNYSYDVLEQEFQASDLETIVDVIEMREHSMYSDWYDNLEDDFFTAKTGSETNNNLNGLPDFIVKNATTGFNGGNPAGFSSGIGGINSSTYTKWKNHTAAYVSVTDDDFVSKLIQSYTYCGFDAPHKYRSNGSDAGEPDFVYYTTFTVKDSLRKYMNSSNDSIGSKIEGYWNSTLYGVPVRRVAALDTSSESPYDSSNPFYGVNWKSMMFYFQRGREMQRSKPVPVADKHNVRVVHLDASCQLGCVDRRANFILYVA